MKKLLSGALVAGTMAIGFLGQVSSAEAATMFQFTNIFTANGSPADGQSGATDSYAQYFGFDVLNTSATQVTFKIYNNTPTTSPIGTTTTPTITDIFFDQSDALSSYLSGIVSATGSNNTVQYSTKSCTGNTGPGNNGCNFPQGNNINWDTDFVALASNPSVQNGVDPTESVSILFNLATGRNYQDVLNAIASTTNLRVGIHVQELPGGASDSFVSVPTPALLPGLIGMGVAAMRKKKREEELETVAQEAEA
ncbi:MAG: hypothetical protein Kow00121_09360 [Elainellaceae cyanobacterium]